MADSSADRNPVELLAEEFVKRQRSGERPTVSEYTERFPQWADEIRDLFPALVVMEQLKPAGNDRTGPYGITAGDGRHLERLGDYRILREVGRGGMGIVYEAEQESLGRHVALKVLPAQALHEAQRLQRFLREARAAARLHHTNIVPVFGVGKAEGLHFYVMQFIPGLGLGEVLEELKQRHEPRTATAGTTVRRAPVAAAAVAQSLLNGAFVGPLAPPVLAVGSDPPAALTPTAPENGAASYLPATPTPSDPPEKPLRPPTSTVHGSGQEASTLAEQGRAYWRSVARIGVQAADALAYAHNQGVLHRDVKPSNLLLETGGNLWITDFGLAKVLADDDNLTNTGDLIGTLRYMAPERFKGPGDARSDLYSLGLTLYELLTLRPAYSAVDRTQLIHKVLHEEPPRPRVVNRRVPRDLETIVLKAMDRDPARRYPTAREMADDLQRFLDDKPINARHVGAVERLQRWCLRNPALATAVGFAVVLLLAVTGVAVAFAVHKTQTAADLTQLVSNLKQERERTREEQQRTVKEQHRTTDALKESRKLAATLATERGLALIDQHQPNLALLWFARALETAPPDDAALERLIRTNLGALTAQPLTRFRTLSPSNYWVVASSPDRRTIVVMIRTRDGFRQENLTKYSHYSATSEDYALHFYDVSTEKPLGKPILFRGKFSKAVFSPDGKTLAVGSTFGEPPKQTGEVQFWDVGTCEPKGPTLKNSTYTNFIEYSPDGSRLLLRGTAAAAVFDVRSAEPLTRFDVELGTVAGFTPDGKNLLLRSARRARVLDAATGKVRCDVTSASILAAALSPDGTKLATAGDDRTVRFWDADTGKAVGPALQHIHPVSHLAFSPDGQRLLTGGGPSPSRGQEQADSLFLGEVRLWKADTGELLFRLPHQERIDSILFSPDGQQIITSSGQSYFLWEADTGKSVGPPVPAPRGGLVLNADGRLFQPLDLWGSVDNKPRARIIPHPFDVTAVVFSPDGTTLLTAMRNGSIGGNPGIARLWDVRTGLPVGEAMTLGDGLNTAVFSPDGKLVFAGAGSWDGTGQVWDAATSKPVGPPLTYEFGSSMHVSAFSPDSKTVAAGGYAKGHYRTVRMWDARTGKDVGVPMRHEEAVTTLAFSPDGTMLLTGSKDQTARLWDARTGRPVGEPFKHKGEVTSVAFSRDGGTVLTASLDRTAQLWQVATRQPLCPPLTHEDGVTCAAFSPDGTVVVTGSADHTARLWSAKTGLPIGMPLRHTAAVRAVAFSPDGGLVLTGSDDHTARLWHAATGIPVGKPLEHSGKVTALAFHPDGRRAVTTSADRGVRLWDIPVPIEGDSVQIARWVQVTTGLELDSRGGVRNLDEPTLAERRKELEELGAPKNTGSLTGGSEWHLRVAMNCLTTGQWFAASWHLDRVLDDQPQNWSAYLLRSRANYYLDRREEAARDYASAFRCGPVERVLAEGRRQAEEYEVHSQSAVGDKVAQAKRLAVAVWHYDQLIAARPDDWKLRHRRGLANGRMGRDEEAERDYDRAAPVATEVEFFIDWGDYHCRRSQWEKAAADYRKAIQLGVENYRTKGIHGTSSLDVWENDALLRLHLGDPKGYREACAALLARRKDTWYVGATNRVAEVCVLGPDALPDIWTPIYFTELAAGNSMVRSRAAATRGPALYRAGRLTEAVDALTEHLRELDDNRPPAPAGNGTPVFRTDWLYLAMAHQRLGNAAEAKKWREKAAQTLDTVLTARRPDGGTSFNPLQILEFQVLLREAVELEARDRQAMAELDGAVTAQPRAPGPLLERGRFFANRGQWERAVTDFDRAVELAPNDAAVRVARGRFHYQAGKPDRAGEDFARALTLRPDDVALRLECARSHVELGQWDRAADDFAAVLARRTDDLDLWMESGHAHAEAGRWKQAAEHFGRAEQLRKKDDAGPLYFQGLAYLAGNDLVGYRQACERLWREFGQTVEPGIVSRVLYTCVALPDSLADMKPLGSVAEKFAMSLRRGSEHIRYAAYLRAGRYDDVIQPLRIARSPTAYDSLLLALACSHQDRAEEARRCLRDAVEWTEKADANRADLTLRAGPRWQHWRERVVVACFRRETERLIQGRAP
jgi:WD40 repeat protein/serine/threonine protein kinase/tetratricopeptide (TPR) repeat protein